VVKVAKNVSKKALTDGQDPGWLFSIFEHSDRRDELQSCIETDVSKHANIVATATSLLH